jgi:hypothetical protein
VVQLQVKYVPGRGGIHPARAPRDVEVYTANGPSWDYEVAGYFQEEDFDSVPGGRPALAMLLRELGAQRGCDAVLLGGNVSRFEGEYRAATLLDDILTYWLRPQRERDRNRETKRHIPVFKQFGVRARCIMRIEPRAVAQQILY